MSLIVFGSLNMDLVVQTPKIPILGETILGHSFFTAPGGKGANQAIAAARLGAKIKMIGRLGDDSFGRDLLDSLKASQVNIDGILIEKNTASGVAIITVQDTGENQIILVPGANGNVNSSDVERITPLFSTTSALLLQLEIPLEAVLTAAKAAKQAGVKVILDPAPAPQNLPDELYTLADIITPNEVEASQLVGFTVQDAESAAKAAAEFRRRGVENAVVKLGEKGVLYATDSEQSFLPAFPVKAVDTVAAGDAFAAAMAVALDENLTFREAMIWGAAAGALTTTKIGAQPSLPYRQELENFLHNYC